MTDPASKTVKRLPLVMLGVMSIAAFGGPFLVRTVLAGGSNRQWPPDRPIEWYVLIGTCSLVAAMMVLLLVMNLRLNREIRREVARVRGAGREPS